MAREVISRLDQEPQLLYYVLSVIYSTINRELLEITDQDELHFQMVMLENLLKHPAYAGKAQ